MGADGWAGYQEVKAVCGKPKLGENMIASKIEGPGPTEPTSAVDFPVQGSAFEVGPVPFLFGEASA